MQIKRFEAKTMTAALKMVKDEFGGGGHPVRADPAPQRPLRGGPLHRR